MAWQSGAAGGGGPGMGGMPTGETTGVQAYTLQGMTLYRLDRTVADQRCKV